MTYDQGAAVLVRFDHQGHERIGLMEGATIGECDATSWADALVLFASQQLRASGAQHRREDVTLLPPLTSEARVFCVAQNYPAHAAEAGGDSPPSPVIFMKPVSSFVGDDQQATLPGWSTAFDYEGEIAVVIGREGAPPDSDHAHSYIAGITAANDGSARDRQPATLAGRFQVDWFSAKSSNSGSALGPGIAHTPDQLESVALRTSLNGNVVQHDTASSMHVSIRDLIVFVSEVTPLHVGDVILTGTPAGVGKARGRTLRDGDRLAVEIDGLPPLTITYAS